MGVLMGGGGGSVGMCSSAATPLQEKILEQIHYHLTGNENLDSCIKECCISHQKFALNIVEIVG